jgi:hypothetical protein
MQQKAPTLFWAIRTGARSAPYDSVAKAGQQRMAGRTDFVGCVIRTVIAGARSAPYDFVGKAGIGANSARGWLNGVRKILVVMMMSGRLSSQF